MDTEQYSLVKLLKKSLRKYRFIFLGVVTITAGLILVTYSNLATQPSTLQSVANDIGVALVTSGLVGLVLEYQTREQFLDDVSGLMSNTINNSPLGSKIDLARSQLETQISMLSDQLSLGNELASLGIRKIYRDRNNINLLAYLDGAKPGSEIRLLGISMLAFTNLQAQLTIERKLQDGCKIKLLTLEPQSNEAIQRAKEEGRGYDDVLRDMKAADELYMNFRNYRLPEDLNRNVEMRHYSTTPTWFILKTDQTMLIGPYLSGSRGIYGPHIELNVEGAGIYQIFDKHFDLVWSSSVVVPS